MTDTFQIQLPDGRTVGVQANSPEEAAQGAKNILAREQGEKQGKGGGALQYVDNLVRQVANGITFGYADEIASALDAALGRKGSYSENLAENRAQDKAFSEANPIAAGAANIAGNIGSTALALPAKATAMGASLVGNMAKFGTVGAGLGAVQGFGEGEGGFTERAAHAVPAAGFGAVGGAAVPVVGAAGQRLSETALGRWAGEKGAAGLRALGELLGESTPLRSLSAAAPDGTAGATPGVFNRAADVIENPAERGMIDRLATALQRENKTGGDVIRRMDKYGPAAVPADTSEGLFREAERAYTLPGGGKDWANNTLDARALAAPSRMRQAFTAGEPIPSGPEVSKAFTENTRAVGRSAYQGDMAEAGLKIPPDLQKLLEQNPTAKGAYDKILKDIAEASKGRPDFVPPSPVEIMHMVKQQLQGLGYDTMTGRALPTQQVWREFADNFVNKLKGSNEALAAADRSYAQAKSLPEFYDSGHNLLTRGSSDKAVENSAPALADILMGADPQQILAARTGATNAVRESAYDISSARRIAKNIIEGEDLQAKLPQLYGQDQAAAIRQAAEAERAFAKTEGLRGNSATARRVGEMLDTGNAGFRVTPDKISPRLYERLADLPNLLLKPNEAVREQTLRAMLNSDRTDTTRILRLADELLKQRQGPHAARLAVGSGGAQSMVRD